MNYTDLKRSLGIAPTQLDTGITADFGSDKYSEPMFLPGMERKKGKARSPVSEDLTALNPPETAACQRVGRIGGRKAHK